MAIKFIEGGGSGPGGDTGVVTGTVQTGAIWNGAKSGSVVVQTTVKEHGFSALKHDTVASASAYVGRLACLQDAGSRGSHRFRFDLLPTATGNATRIITWYTSAAAQIGGIAMRADGSLSLLGGASGTAVVVSTAAGTIAASNVNWRRLSWAFTITSATVNEWRVWLDGVLILTASNVASTVTASSQIRVGWSGTAAGANIVTYSQDHYIDDSNALTDPGDVRVTAKRPASLGSTNAFDTLVGTGTNRYDRVAERPINTANGMTQGGTAVVREQFGVEAASAGDDNLTGATILGWAAWVHFSVVAAVGSTLAQPIVNGTDTAYTTVAASGAYQTTYNVAAVTTYPGSNAVGLKSTGSAVDTLLAECGVYVAYIAAAAATQTVSVDTATATGAGVVPTTLRTTQAPTATASAAGVVPVLQAVITVPTATATAAGVTITVAEVPPPFTVAAPTAAATAAGVAPTIATTIAVPVAAATGAGVTPTLLDRMALSTATANAAGVAPIMRVIVAVPTATALAAGIAVTARVLATPATATAAAAGVAPTLQVIAIPPTATATAAGVSATIQTAANVLTIDVPTATAAAAAIAPTISVLALVDVATASADAVAPTVRIVLVAPTATASAAGVVVTVATLAPGGDVVTVLVPTALASAAAIVPVLHAIAALPTALASAAGVPLSLRAVILPPTAAASATGISPIVGASGGVIYSRYVGVARKRSTTGHANAMLGGRSSNAASSGVARRVHS